MSRCTTGAGKQSCGRRADLYEAQPEAQQRLHGLRILVEPRREPCEHGGTRQQRTSPDHRVLAPL